MVHIIEDTIDLTFICEMWLKDDDMDITNVWNPVVLRFMDITK